MERKGYGKFPLLDRHVGISQVKMEQDKDVPKSQEHAKGTEAVVSTLCFRTGRNSQGKERERKLEGWKGLKELATIGILKIINGQ